MKYKLCDVTKSANTGADAIKRAPIVEENTGLRCLRIGDVSQKRSFNEWGYTKTTEDDYKRYKLEQNDIIIARTGNTIGVNCFIENDIESVYNNGLIRIKADTDKIIPKFMYYIIRSQDCQNFVQSIAYGTSTQPNMKIQEFLNYEFEYYNKDVQSKIVSIIDSIDKKIELNTSLNNNLEQQAMALFKQKIIKNCDNNKNGTIGEYCSVKSGYAFKGTWWQDNGVKVIKIKTIDNDSINFNDCSYVSNDKIEFAKDFIVQGGDLLIAMTGATIGKFAIIPKVNEPLLVNQRVGKFFLGSEPLNRLPFLYCSLKQQDVITEIINRGQGSAQPNISSSDIMTTPIYLPSKYFVDEFNELCTPIFETLITNKYENEQLAKLRDTLLPKLMSGEIDVSNVDISTDKLSFSCLNVLIEF